MAKVWPVYEGGKPTIGGPWAVLPLDEAIRVLELEPQHPLTALPEIPVFGDKEQDLAWMGYQHIVVELGEDEANANWKPGFYRSPLAPSEAFYGLLGWRIGSQIGPDWRVELEDGRDAEGDPAIWAWITLRAGARADAWTRENRESIRTKVRKVVTESGIRDWVFVRFRDEKEERPPLEPRVRATRSGADPCYQGP